MRMRIRGISVLEIIIVVAIIAILSVLGVQGLLSFARSQALQKDVDTIIATLIEARGKTLASVERDQYGVHFGSPKVILFKGGSYVVGAASNREAPLSSRTTMTASLAGGGSNVVFQRLSGKTSQNGTIVVSVPGTTLQKTIIIHETGIAEVQQ